MRFQRTVWSPCEVDYLRTHKDEALNQLSIHLAKSRNAITTKLRELAGQPVKSQAGKRGRLGNKIGRRPDLGVSLRSGWEANIFRLLRQDKKVAVVEYEPVDFGFWDHGIKTGTVSYTPDFRVTYKDGTTEWLEVKGYMKASDKTRIRRFKKFYPAEYAKLRCIVGSASTQAAKFFAELQVPVWAYYNELNKKYHDSIPHWE